MKHALASIAALLFATMSYADDFTIGTVRTLHSKVLDEDRRILIYLPPGYETHRAYTKYPVLYLLDGRKFFHSFTGAIHQLSSDATPRIPEMIVVGIESQNRVRDSSPTHSRRGYSGKEEPGYESSGGANAFLAFLRTELIPFIDREYSTSDYRIFTGYSFTGLAVLHALFTSTSTFDAYVIIDPSWWWDDYVMEKRAVKFAREAKVDKVEVFVATSGEPYPTNLFPKTTNASALIRIFEKSPVNGLRWGFKHYANESHHSMPMLALADGLTHIFEGHAPSLENLYNHIDKIEEQHQALSKRLGTQIHLREDLVADWGFFYLDKQPEKALPYFAMNVRNYPQSAQARTNLAQAQEVLLRK